MRGPWSREPVLISPPRRARQDRGRAKIRLLDIEEFSAPEDDGTDIVSVAELKQHIRISPHTTALDADISASIIDAAARLHGRAGDLGRSILPTIWRRYLPAFPRGGIIRLPYPPLIEVLGVEYVDVDGGSPPLAVEPNGYVVRNVDVFPEIVFLSPPPQTQEHPRAVCVTYRAGYLDYPDTIKRAVKFLAAHLLTNKSATDGGSLAAGSDLAYYLAPLRVPHCSWRDH